MPRLLAGTCRPLAPSLPSLAQNCCIPGDGLLPADFPRGRSGKPRAGFKDFLIDDYLESFLLSAVGEDEDTIHHPLESLDVPLAGRSDLWLPRLCTPEIVAQATHDFADWLDECDCCPCCG